MNNAMKQALETLENAGYTVDSDDCTVTQREGRKWGIVQLEEATANGREIISTCVAKGKPSGAFCSGIREALKNAGLGI